MELFVIFKRNQVVVGNEASFSLLTTELDPQFIFWSIDSVPSTTVRIDYININDVDDR